MEYLLTFLWKIKISNFGVVVYGTFYNLEPDVNCARVIQKVVR